MEPAPDSAPLYEGEKPSWETPSLKPDFEAAPEEEDKYPDTRRSKMEEKEEIDGAEDQGDVANEKTEDQDNQTPGNEEGDQADGTSVEQEEFQPKIRKLMM